MDLGCLYFKALLSLQTPSGFRALRLLHKANCFLYQLSQPSVSLWLSFCRQYGRPYAVLLIRVEGRLSRWTRADGARALYHAFLVLRGIHDVSPLLETLFLLRFR